MTYAPINLYRLQLHHEFTFKDAERIFPYLQQLGIDTLYCSPIFEAVAKSRHGYDVTNPLHINKELGGEEGFYTFCKKAHTYGFGVIVDVVANHMAASLSNPWWRDVLKHGPSSRYAGYFAIDWSSSLHHLTGKVLVPILDVPFYEAVEQGKIGLALQEREVVIRAMGQFFPVSERSYSLIPSEIFSHKNCIAKINSDKKLLLSILDKQYFFLEFWQAAAQSINYRRFFDIHSLVALNMDNPKCFDDFHALIIRLFNENYLQGFRIDHPDGFYDPSQYFLSLRKQCKRSPYIVIEKILERDERIPHTWLVHGSVGYEYLNTLNQLFVDPQGAKALTALYEALLEKSIDAEKEVQEEKRMFVRRYLPSEVRFMASCLTGRDSTQELLQEAIVELYAFFPVYRTYVDPSGASMSEEDRSVLLEAFDKAQVFAPHLEGTFQLLHDIFFQRDSLSQEEKVFLTRFQQIAPAVMAKGFEDTHLYNYNRLLSLNEVGSWPHHFGEEPAFFHEKMQSKQKECPWGWMTLSTHDTKRSYEMRMRLHVLSECAEEWKEQVRMWREDNSQYKHQGFPDANIEYFLYQSLVGFWPAQQIDAKERQSLIDRVQAYLMKAAREAKAYTNWIHHHTAYEHALQAFIGAILQEDSLFYPSMLQWVYKISSAGEKNSIAGLNLSLFLPAPFDVYQGTELFDFSFVDPDNRRKVDYSLRQSLLQNLENRAHQDLESFKMYMLHKALSIRKKLHSSLITASYEPLEVRGSQEKHVVAYLRDRNLLVLSGRFFFEHRDFSFWKDTEIQLPKGWEEKPFREIYTQKRLRIKNSMRLDDLLSSAPASAWMVE